MIAVTSYLVDGPERVNTLVFFCVPSCISRVHHLGKIFVYVTFLFWFGFFFNLTIEEVTFRLRGWCVLGVFLLLAFARLEHECQDLLSPCDGMHVCTDWTSVYTIT